MQQLYMEFGDTRIDLNGGSTRLASSFVPGTGGEDNESVSERIELMFEALEEGEVSPIGDINRMLVVARYLQNRNSSNYFVYLRFAETEAETAWRSRVLDGGIFLDSNYGFWKQGGVTRFDLVVEREPFWEADELTQLPLTNTNGTDDTSGLTVFPSCADGTGTSPNDRVNYVKINDEDVEGDLPAPLHVVFAPMNVSTGAPAYEINKIWYGVYPDLFMLGLSGARLPDYDIETFTDTGVTATSDTDASGGTYYAIPITASAAVEAKFDFGDLSKTRGSWYRFFLRTFGPAPDGMWIKLRAKHDDLIQGETPWVQIISTSEVTSVDGTRVYDLGLMKLPPMDYPTDNPEFEGEVYCYVSGTGTLNLDAIQYFGVDYYAELGRGNRTDGFGIADISIPTTTVMFYDSWGSDERSVVYVDDHEASPKLEEFQYFTERIGDGLYVTPGVDNYVYIITRAPVANYNFVNYKGTLKVYYRPRRRNI